jgi:signal transduction histidine kinase
VSDRELARKARIAELLLDAARQLGETLEPERVYDRFHDLLAARVQHDAVVVSSYDEREGLIRCDYAWVEGNRLDPAIFPPVKLNPEGGMQSQVIVRGEPLLFNDVTERVQGPGTFYDVDAQGEVRKLPESGPPGTQAVMMVPVKNEGRVVGVVQLMSDRGEYDSDELELFEGLVGQMAAAVRNARLQRERVRLQAAEQAARFVAAEREQAAQVLQIVGDGIFLVDREGVIRLWNRAAEVTTGLFAAEVTGRPVADVLPRWSDVSVGIPVAEGGIARRSVTLPLELGGRDVWLSFVAVRGPDGIVYAFRDVTAERRLDEEKSDFVATVSHELRTPMAAVYGASQTLLRRGDELKPEDARTLLEMIGAQSTRLSQIVEDVLIASRLDRGDLPVERERLDLAGLVRSAAEALQSSTDEDASFEVVAPAAVSAYGDADRIQQVLLNLLDNAVKYGGGGVTVRVVGGTGVARVSVSDGGPGIPRAEQQRIFDKFYRGDPQLTHAPGGTGLGLYISRELMRRMGGRLEVRSEPGAGATFVIELPAG